MSVKTGGRSGVHTSILRHVLNTGDTVPSVGGVIAGEDRRILGCYVTGDIVASGTAGNTVGLDHQLGFDSGPAGNWDGSEAATGTDKVLEIDDTAAIAIWSFELNTGNENLSIGPFVFDFTSMGGVEWYQREEFISHLHVPTFENNVRVQTLVYWEML